MQIATRSQYEERSFELAGIAFKYAPRALGIAAVLALANLAGFPIGGASVFVGLAFALALPLIISAVAAEQGAHNERGTPALPVAIAGQLAMLMTIYLALSF
jgi:hypothetical protein